MTELDWHGDRAGLPLLDAAPLEHDIDMKAVQPIGSHGFERKCQKIHWRPNPQRPGQYPLCHRGPEYAGFLCPQYSITLFADHRRTHGPV